MATAAITSTRAHITSAAVHMIVTPVETRGSAIRLHAVSSAMGHSAHPPRILAVVVSFLLSVTFACGVVIAVAHVINVRFIAPVYDVVANLIAFASAVAASLMLGHWIPAGLSSLAVLCWLVLARRTWRALRRRSSVPAGEPASAH